MDHDDVRRWVSGYERAWRSPDVGALREVFTDDVTYLPSPWARPVEGIDDLASYWDAERDGPNERFTLETEIVAVDGGRAVVRVAVEYPDQPDGH